MLKGLIGTIFYLFFILLRSLINLSLQRLNIFKIAKLLHAIRFIINIIIPVASMNNDSLRDSHHKQQTQIYDNLSSFMQILKRLFSLSEQTTNHVQKGNDHVFCIEKISLVLKQLDPLIQKYNTSSESLKIEQITFYRFVCRLYEIISLYKLKYQNCSSIYVFNCFLMSLREIQAAIKQYEPDKQLGKMMKFVKVSIIKFCMSCKVNKTSENVSEQQKYTQVIKQIRSTKIHQKRYHFREKNNLELNYSEYEDEPDEQQLVKTIHLTKNEKNYPVNQLMLDLQKRFSLLYGLELDFSFFKSSYFNAKNNSEQFYKDYLQRNVPISNIISTYQDDFQIKRKNTKYRKNNLNKTKGRAFDLVLNQSWDQNIKTKNEKQQVQYTRNTKLNQTINQQLKDIKSIKNSNKNQSQYISNDSESNKISLKMKNVYITLGKKNGQSKSRHNNTGISNLNRNKVGLQSVLINQACFNDREHSQIEFLNSKLKISQNYSNFNNNRMKTEPEKALHIQKYCQVEKLKLQKSAITISPIKRDYKQPQFKYLQINCITKKEDSKNSRLILSGNHTNAKFTIKNMKKMEEQKNKIIVQNRGQ